MIFAASVMTKISPFFLLLILLRALQIKEPDTIFDLLPHDSWDGLRQTLRAKCGSGRSRRWSDWWVQIIRQNLPEDDQCRFTQLSEATSDAVSAAMMQINLFCRIQLNLFLSAEADRESSTRESGDRAQCVAGFAAEGSGGGLQIWPELHAFSQQQSEGIPDRKLWEAASDSNN